MIIHSLNDSLELSCSNEAVAGALRGSPLTGSQAGGEGRELPEITTSIGFIGLITPSL